jgi:hypothetical protein
MNIKHRSLLECQFSQFSTHIGLEFVKIKLKLDLKTLGFKMEKEVPLKKPQELLARGENIILI